MLNCAVRRCIERRGVSRARRDGARFWEARRSRSCREGKRKKTLTRQFSRVFRRSTPVSRRSRFFLVHGNGVRRENRRRASGASARRDRRLARPREPLANSRSGGECAIARVEIAPTRARKRRVRGRDLSVGRRDAERFSRRAGGFAHAQCPRRPGLRRARDRA